MRIEILTGVGRYRESTGSDYRHAGRIEITIGMGHRERVPRAKQVTGIFEYAASLECDGGGAVHIFRPKLAWLDGRSFDLAKVSLK